MVDSSVDDALSAAARARERVIQAKRRELAAHQRAAVLHEQAAELQQRLGHKEEAEAALQRADHARELHSLALAELAEWGLAAAL
jgi:hypothetical protein